MDFTTREYKDEAARRLAAIDVERYQLQGIDPRLYSYVCEVRNNPEAHNLYEVLAVIKFFRLMDEYVFLPSKVKKFAAFYESLKFSGMDGRRSYRLTPIQYFQFANILGFYVWEEVEHGHTIKPKKGVKQKVEDGVVYELRRLCREAILFVPRKFSKTTSTASLAVHELLFGDTNAQAYTAANSYKQAKICFEEISKIVRQLDMKKKYFKPTRETLHWKQPNKFGKESFVECLTGGADTKDGLAASLVIFDEYAQASYVKDHSVGAELLQVLNSSMGTRREPLTIIITTASRVSDGPFAVDLENAKKILRDELRDDSTFASLFMPDYWEQVDDEICKKSVWRKCNPHIGITVQGTYYARQWEKAQRDAESMIEFKTKLLNIFVSQGAKTWIPASMARALQTDIDLDAMKGRPSAMVALDLSVSDDFSVVVYNIYSPVNKKFYLYLDCYIPEETLNNHPNSELYRIWVSAGWMHVCEGAVIDGRMIVRDILARNKQMKILQIGYDAYKSQEIVNLLAAAISGAGGKPENILKAVPQNYASFTSPVETFEMAAKSNPPRVALDNNPIWPYCFGTCYLDVDKMENKKPLKRMANCKIDAAIGGLMTFWMYNNFEF